jgi:RNA polymerase sigma factor (sigma-70 family)
MEESSAGRLYRKHGPAIYSRCRTLLRDKAAAEDATQETFLRVYKNLKSAPDDDQARLWIFRIATNVCIDQLRTRGRNLPGPETFPAAAGRSAEEILADQDLAGKIIARAPEKLRSVAWLYYVDGMDQEEIARVLGVTVRTVQSRTASFLKRARKFVLREAP